jgi:hypothetical protein
MGPLVRRRICTRCKEGDLGPWRGVWCLACEEATRDATLHVLLYLDRSAIFGLYETGEEARDAYAEDTRAIEEPRLRRAVVTGQAGARAELRLDDDGWTDRERAWDRADFERGVL